jgi:hypothetical protein
MKRLFYNLLGVVIVSTPMLFASCGNGDNALEEIINGNSNSVISALAEALEEGAEVSVDLSLTRNSTTSSYIVTYTKTDDSYTLKTVQVGDQTVTSETAGFDDFLNLINMTFDKNTNLLKFSFTGPYNIAPTTRMRNPIIPYLTIVFDVAKNTYTEYYYPCVPKIKFNGISVDGVEKKDLLTSDYTKKADFYNTGGTDYVFSMYYADGETWADVNKRYNDIAGNPLLKDATEGDDIKLVVATMNIDVLYGDNEPKVKYGDKVCYKDNAAHTTGYVLSYPN